jgi:tRNA 5-methylaminomethyl-2-thiouridine biosynthesis bifunctional protein
MELYDYVIVGAGAAGCSIAHFLQDKKVLIVDKAGICQKASNAAGAFLFPKVGFNTKYTKFVNDALLFAFKFYKKL